MNSEHYDRLYRPRIYRKLSRLIISIIVLLLIGFVFQGCLHTAQRDTISPDEFRQRAQPASKGRSSMEHEHRFLKAHMKDGSLYAFTEWSIDDSAQSISGQGYRFDTYRTTSETGELTVEIDSVAIFETNNTRPSSTIAAMTVITSISLAITAYCIANPKACFGSCPTIYSTDGKLQAEGFSASIAPSLEADDIDIIRTEYRDDHQLSLYVRNEALETHVIRSMNLLAVPKREEAHVYRGIDGQFYQTSNWRQPLVMETDETFDVEDIRHLDGNEHFRKADSSDLAAKDTLELTFDCPDCERVGIIIGCRQSLLSTYLLYSGLSYLGSQATHWLAQMERGNSGARDVTGRIGRALGGIDVLIPDGDRGWMVTGSANETGPLAVDVHVVPLPRMADRDSIRIGLRTALGHWRIDYVALACLDMCKDVVELTPARVVFNSSENQLAKDKLLDSSQVLITFPGDEYLIAYDLPRDGRDYDLFVKSRGYYLEWIRDEWVAEEDFARAAEMFFTPNKALKRMAPEFKEVEDDMEDVFWNSKYSR